MSPTLDFVLANWIGFDENFALVFQHNLIYAMNELVQIVVWDYTFTWVKHCVIEQAYNVDIPDGTNLVQVAFLPQNISIFENVTCLFTIVKHQYFLPIELN